MYLEIKSLLLDQGILNGVPGSGMKIDTLCGGWDFVPVTGMGNLCHAGSNERHLY